MLESTNDDTSTWRRQHAEGPIDDRWTRLCLDEDEITGDLILGEIRKEWYLGSRNRITSYTKEIVFPEVCLNEDKNEDEPETGELGPHGHDLSVLPDDPILRLLRPHDSPHHIRPPPRKPQNTHPINSGFFGRISALVKVPIHHYITSASTYLALVDTSDPTDSQGKQRLGLRAISRKPGPPLRQTQGEEFGVLRSPNADLRTALMEMYREQPIAHWPPDTQDPETLDLYRLLNPCNNMGNVEGKADERSLVYATGGPDKPRALVFVGFDPAMRLPGLKTW